ncbi:MAG: hypothetical protein GXP40_08525, partial [Chloroflexi bacterium]|nr:hypothetical protein [Chloroflexota bacterium]
MTTLSPAAEFTIARRYDSDRSSPARWIWSHTTRHWWLIIIILIGATGNAGLAAL